MNKTYHQQYPHLFQPLTIRGKRLKNRIISSPHGDPRMFTVDSSGYAIFSEEAARYYGNIARGGAAIVNTGHLGIDPRFYLGAHREYFDFHSKNFINSRILPSMHRMTERIHAYGSLASLELNHGGQWCTPKDDILLMGPSSFTNVEGREIQGISEEEMEKIADYFAEAAYIGKRGGFDVVNIHAAHNWLLGEFFSPNENLRTDQYGGSVENRLRFPKMVLERIRKRVGEDMIIAMRISGTEIQENGITLEEVSEIVRGMSEFADIVQCSAGKIHDSLTEAFTFPSQYMDEGVNTYLAEYVRAHSDVVIETVGGIHNPTFADKLIENGVCDLVGMARSFIADPDWGEKAKQNRAEDIRPCIRCLHCLDFCEPLDSSGSISYCSVNPRRAFVTNVPEPIISDGSPKNVVIIGGGPAGMQAAIEIADRGHQVTLLEKGEKLGGRLDFADYLTFKKGVKNFREYLITQVTKRANITVKCQTEASSETVSAMHPDAVVVAVGAEKFLPPIQGLDSSNVIHASEVLPKLEQLDGNVVIIGGGEVGCEIAIQLQAQGKTVDLIEVQDELMKDAKCFWQEKDFTEFFLTHKFSEGIRTFVGMPEDHHVTIHLNTKCTKITEDGVFIEKDGREAFLNASTVILSTGLRNSQSRNEEFEGIADTVIYIGDCKEVSNIENATRTALNASFQI